MTIIDNREDATIIEDTAKEEGKKETEVITVSYTQLGVAGKIIDLLAVFALLAGTATTFSAVSYTHLDVYKRQGRNFTG